MIPIRGRRAGFSMLDVAVALCLLAGLAVLAFHLRTTDVEGPVRVVDGDTLEQARRRIRLAGLDAPEMGQSCERAGGPYRCGEEARSSLGDIIGRNAVTCRISGADRYGRDLGRCRTGAGDLGAELVRRGWAVAAGAYQVEEASARSRRSGLWAGTFEQPATWRHRQPGYRAP